MLEVAISVTLFTVVILSAMSMIESGGKLSRSTLEVAAVEGRCDLGFTFSFILELSTFFLN